MAEDPSSLSMTRAHQLSQSSSDALQALVRQQLELIAAPNLRWEGQLWPGVPMTMILTELPRENVHDDAGDSPDRSEQEEGASDWRAEVQVRLPSLGVIDIIFVTRRNAALQVEVKPAEETTRVQLRQELIPMRERLASLGMSVELIVGESEYE
ncbi:flagellar hook-length control protein FliK [Salinicola salarius]|uniref:flagellar hook-length control protein FliK n=1 Tax=Salinicola salarius TaxID=430457 RepID=UPI000B406F69|nr:flagellar hook-length control protein FliK [Salinicola salarius]